MVDYIQLKIVNLYKTLGLHELQYIHRDIKPENFLMGVNKEKNIVHLIDFGLSKRYIDKNNKHIPLHTDKDVIGTKRYLSLNVLSGNTPSRRDDLISVIYILIFFRRGDLPWNKIDLKYKNQPEIERKKLQLKLREVKGLNNLF